MTAGVVKYRAEGDVDFTFRFVWRPTDTTWRIYIVDQPSYGTRSASLHPTHRLRDEHGFYVCWDTRIADFEDARWIASVWANATVTYIRTGAAITGPSQRINPGDRSVLAGHSEAELRAALTDGGTRRTQTRSTSSSTISPSGTNQPSPIRRLLERIR